MYKYVHLITSMYKYEHLITSMYKYVHLNTRMYKYVHAQKTVNLERGHDAAPASEYVHA